MNELLKSIIFQVTVQYNIIREQIHAISITFDDLIAYICFCELTYWWNNILFEINMYFLNPQLTNFTCKKIS